MVRFPDADPAGAQVDHPAIACSSKDRIDGRVVRVGPLASPSDRQRLRHRDHPSWTAYRQITLRHAARCASASHAPASGGVRRRARVEGPLLAAAGGPPPSG